MNHQAARDAAASLAFPDDGKGTWAPHVYAAIVTPVRDPKWTVEKCARVLGVEPSGVEDWQMIANVAVRSPACSSRRRASRTGSLCRRVNRAR